MYRVQKDKEPADFLEWMLEHASMFKGYGKMGLKVFHEYREKIVYYANKEVHERLVRALEQTDFKEWSAEHGYKTPDYDRGVVQYLKNKKRRKDPGIDQNSLRSIQRDHLLYYSKMEKNLVMLRELYAAILIPQEERDSGRSIVFQKQLKNMPSEFHFMTDDYVSKLLTVSKQKECLFRLSSEYAKTRDKKWSIKIKSQKQRCRQVQRSDILPMIQWVAVHRYLEENEKQDGEYDQQEAKEMFEQMAEEALQKCDMAPLNPRYRLDFVLLSCFGDTEMSYLSEILCEYIQPEEE